MVLEHLRTGLGTFLKRMSNLLLYTKKVKLRREKLRMIVKILSNAVFPRVMNLIKTILIKKRAPPADSHTLYIPPGDQVVPKAPPIGLLERFCAAIGEHEPSNRFFMLRGVSRSATLSVIPENDDYDSERKCCYCLLDRSYEWLVECIPEIDNYHMDNCSREQTVPTYPCDYETLFAHANVPIIVYFTKLMVFISIRYYRWKNIIVNRITCIILAGVQMMSFLKSIFPQ